MKLDDFIRIKFLEILKANATIINKKNIFLLIIAPFSLKYFKNKIKKNNKKTWWDILITGVFRKINNNVNIKVIINGNRVIIFILKFLLIDFLKFNIVIIKIKISSVENKMHTTKSRFSRIVWLKIFLFKI